MQIRNETYEVVVEKKENPLALLSNQSGKIGYIIVAIWCSLVYHLGGYFNPRLKRQRIAQAF